MTSRLARLLTAALVGAVLVTTPAAPAFADETRDDQWMIDALDLEKAWETTKGEGVTVGIVDTGVDATHPDIENNVLPGISVLGKEPDPADDALTDPEGHGTAMASLIAGHGHGSGGQDGIIGIAPEAKVLSVRGTETQDELEWPTPSATEDGIRWLADNGADVILLAYGGSLSENVSEREAIQYAAIDHHIPVIAGSGNHDDGGLVEAPANYEEVLGISGVTQDGEFWKHAGAGREVAFAAPAENVAAADKDQGYKTHSGTSRSSAIAAGVMALLKAQYPDATRMELYWRITELADNAGEDCNNEIGCGIVDPVAALTEDPGPLPEEMQDPKPLPEDDEDDQSSSADGDQLTATSGSNTTLWITLATLAVLLILTTAAIITLARKKRKHHNTPATPQTTAPHPPIQQPPPTSDHTVWQRPTQHNPPSN